LATIQKEKYRHVINKVQYVSGNWNTFKRCKHIIRTNFDIKLKVLSTSCVIVCLIKIPKLKQSEFVAIACLAEGQFLKEWLKETNECLGASE
jgi:hypothetical protein